VTKKEIDTLVPDIYEVLKGSVPSVDDSHPDEIIQYALNVANAMRRSLTPRKKGRELGKYWATDLGKPCDRSLWFDFNLPEGEEVEELEGHTRFKFMYGDTIEEKVLFLGKLTGHSIGREQERVELKLTNNGNDIIVSGRLDAVIDRTMVDVKSASPFAYNKYVKEGIHSGNDTFGYLWQLGYYFWFATPAAGNSSAAFLFIDKSMGHMAVKMVPRDQMPDDSAIERRAKTIDLTVREATPPVPPAKVAPVPDGKSGNMKLCTTCSYCKYKAQCYPTLRTFIYSTGPRFLTNVARTPNVPEAT